MAVGKLSRGKKSKKKDLDVPQVTTDDFDSDGVGNKEIASSPTVYCKPLADLSSNMNAREGNIYSLAPLSALEAYHRIPFGNASLDYMTGGGIPMYAVTSFWGAESSGKSSALYDMFAASQLTCWRCRFPKNYCKCSTAPIIKPSALIAVEGLPDVEFLKHIGVDPDSLYVTLPESAEHAFDVAVNILKYDACVLGIDSITMVSPEAEATSSAEQQFMGLQARSIGRFLRTIRNALNRRIRQQEPVGVVLINQMRYKLSNVVGNPETRSGGSALKHTDELLVRFGKVALKKDVNPDKLLLPQTTHGLPTGARTSVSLNKTKFFCISRDDSYVRLIGNNENFEHLRVGQLIDAITTLKAAQACGVITKDSKGYRFPFLDQTFETQKELLEFVSSDRQNKMLIMKMATQQAWENHKKGAVISATTLGPEKVTEQE